MISGPRSADQRDRLLLEVGGGHPGQLGRLLGDQRPGLVGAQRGPEELVDRAQVDRQRVDLAGPVGVHPVLVGGERGEPVGVVPDRAVRGVEQVRPVAMHLDPGRRVGLGVGVSTQVPAPLDHGHVAPEIVRDPFGDGQPEEPGADDQEIHAGGAPSGRERSGRRRPVRASSILRSSPAGPARRWGTTPMAAPVGSARDRGPPGAAARRARPAPPAPSCSIVDGVAAPDRLARLRGSHRTGCLPLAA